MCVQIEQVAILQMVQHHDAVHTLPKRSLLSNYHFHTVSQYTSRFHLHLQEKYGLTSVNFRDTHKTLIQLKADPFNRNSPKSSDKRGARI